VTPPDFPPEADWQQDAEKADDESMAGAWIAIAVFMGLFAAICVAAGYALAKLT
jgi:hypothetical protein